MTTLTHKRFIEIASNVSVSLRVDREAGIIRGVKLCGIKSINGREYPESVLRSAIAKYEEAKAYLGHQRREERGNDRPFQDWLGVIRNARWGGDGNYGDLYLRRESGHFSSVCEAAEKFPNNFGCSHVASGSSRYRDGVEIIESIETVFSVDIVTEPATARGLFESASDPAVSAAAEALSTAKFTSLFDRFAEQATKAVATAAAAGDSSPLTDLIGTVNDIVALAVDWVSDRAADSSDADAAELVLMAGKLVISALGNPAREDAIALLAEAIATMRQALGVIYPGPSAKSAAAPTGMDDDDIPATPGSEGDYFTGRKGGGKSYEQRFGESAKRAGDELNQISSPWREQTQTRK